MRDNAAKSLHHLPSRPAPISRTAKGSTAFDKYAAYTKAVQSPDEDARFLDTTYRELRGTRASVMREDFCGTFALACEWAKLRATNVALGVDLDPEPIEYGMRHHFDRLTRSQRGRVRILQDNVLSPTLPHADLVCALNFSYFIFRERSLLLQYFRNCVSTLNDGGIMVVDAFGGRACQKGSTDVKKMGGLTYYWQQEGFDPISHEATFHIHFKPRGRRTIKSAFSYHWRLWAIPEIREAMLESGFSKTHVYWEGTARNGSGNGIFTRTEKGEECEVWIAYIVGER